jgi:hypothetical protein
MEVSSLLGILAGIIAIVVGLIPWIERWPMFLVVLRGTLPVLLILISLGLGVLVFFMSEIKSKREVEKVKTSPPSEEKKCV